MKGRADVPMSYWNASGGRHAIADVIPGTTSTDIPKLFKKFPLPLPNTKDLRP